MPEKFPFTIYITDPAGLGLVGSIGNDPITSQPLMLRPGDSLEVTEQIYLNNCDRFGKSWLDHSDEDQVKHWGRIRFTRNELPAEVAASLESDRVAALQSERDFLLRANPRLAKASAATMRLSRIEAELEVQKAAGATAAKLERGR